jgi:hypothetical protein
MTEAATPSIVLAVLAVCFILLAFRGSGKALREVSAANPAVAGLAAFVLIIALGWFHVVFHRTFPFVVVVAKRDFNYSMSLTTLDNIIDRYNVKHGYEHLKADPVLDPLVNALKAKGMLGDK